MLGQTISEKWAKKSSRQSTAGKQITGILVMVIDRFLFLLNFEGSFAAKIPCMNNHYYPINEKKKSVLTDIFIANMV